MSTKIVKFNQNVVTGIQHQYLKDLGNGFNETNKSEFSLKESVIILFWKLLLIALIFWSFKKKFKLNNTNTVINMMIQQRRLTKLVSYLYYQKIGYYLVI